MVTHPPIASDVCSEILNIIFTNICSLTSMLNIAKRNGLARPSLAGSAAAARIAPPMTRTAYVPPGGKTLLPHKRALRKLRIGELRPAIYYKFDCAVELSDGSTVMRRSQFPKDEIRYLSDQKTHPLWNPSRPNLKALEADATGKMAKFKKKYGDFDSAVSTSSSDSVKDADASQDSGAVDTGFFDMLDEKVVPVQSGGQLMSILRKKGKKGKKR